MNIPRDLLYTKEHEWARIEGNRATIGITDHAQSSLGDVVYLELPEVGKELKSGDTFGVVESVKAVSDLYAPLTGKVVETNKALVSEPGQINSDPYVASWLVKIELQNPSERESLMDSAKYEAYVKTLQ